MDHVPPTAETGPCPKRQKLTQAPSPSLAAAPPATIPASEPLTAATRHIAEHGNYKNYYQKRKPSVHGDARLAVIPPAWLKGARVLDVGCNSGVVTIEVAQKFAPARVTGVDIDDTLIAAARKNLDLAWSRLAPSSVVLAAARSSATRDPPPHARRSVTESTALAAPPALPPTPSNLAYFPLALPRLLGFIPQPPYNLLTTYEAQPEIETTGVTKRGKRKVMPLEILSFPDSVRFHTADWPTDTISSDKKGYNIILAFSITKWIHLHTLNAGVHAFFAKCFTCLLPGGRLVLEPQPFSSYGKSVRFSDKLKDNYAQLLKDGPWKNEDGDFERILLEEIGFERREKLGTTGRDGFKRPVDVYYKRGGSWV